MIPQEVVFDEVHPPGSPVQFGKDHAVRYRTMPGFVPTSGDWIGLFRCIQDACEIIGLEWVGSAMTSESGSGEKSLIFRGEHIKWCLGATEEDDYHFVYVTGAGKLAGQSGHFQVHDQAGQSVSAAQSSLSFGAAESPDFRALAKQCLATCRTMEKTEPRRPGSSDKSFSAAPPISCQAPDPGQQDDQSFSRRIPESCGCCPVNAELSTNAASKSAAAGCSCCHLVHKELQWLRERLETGGGGGVSEMLRGMKAEDAEAHRKDADVTREDELYDVIDSLKLALDRASEREMLLQQQLKAGQLQSTTDIQAKDGKPITQSGSTSRRAISPEQNDEPVDYSVNSAATGKISEHKQQHGRSLPLCIDKPRCHRNVDELYGSRRLDENGAKVQTFDSNKIPQTVDQLLPAQTVVVKPVNPTSGERNLDVEANVVTIEINGNAPVENIASTGSEIKTPNESEVKSEQQSETLSSCRNAKEEAEDSKKNVVLLREGSHEDRTLSGPAKTPRRSLNGVHQQSATDSGIRLDNRKEFQTQESQTKSKSSEATPGRTVKDKEKPSEEWLNRKNNSKKEVRQQKDSNKTIVTVCSRGSCTSYSGSKLSLWMLFGDEKQPEKIIAKQMKTSSQQSKESQEGQTKVKSRKAHLESKQLGQSESDRQKVGRLRERSTDEKETSVTDKVSNEPISCTNTCKVAGRYCHSPGMSTPEHDRRPPDSQKVKHNKSNSKQSSTKPQQIVPNEPAPNERSTAVKNTFQTVLDQLLAKRPKVGSGNLAQGTNEIDGRATISGESENVSVSMSPISSAKECPCKKVNGESEKKSPVSSAKACPCAKDLQKNVQEISKKNLRRNLQENLDKDIQMDHRDNLQENQDKPTVQDSIWKSTVETIILAQPSLLENDTRRIPLAEKRILHESPVQIVNPEDSELHTNCDEELKCHTLELDAPNAGLPEQNESEIQASSHHVTADETVTSADETVTYVSGIKTILRSVNNSCAKVAPKPLSFSEEDNTESSSKVSDLEDSSMNEEIHQSIRELRTPSPDLQFLLSDTGTPCESVTVDTESHEAENQNRDEDGNRLNGTSELKPNTETILRAAGTDEGPVAKLNSETSQIVPATAELSAFKGTSEAQSQPPSFIATLNTRLICDSIRDFHHRRELAAAAEIHQYNRSSTSTADQEKRNIRHLANTELQNLKNFNESDAAVANPTAEQGSKSNMARDRALDMLDNNSTTPLASVTFQSCRSKRKVGSRAEPGHCEDLNQRYCDCHVHASRLAKNSEISQSHELAGDDQSPTEMQRRSQDDAPAPEVELLQSDQ